MPFRLRLHLNRLLALAVFASLSFWAQAAEDLSKPLGELKPTLNQAIASVNTVQMLKRDSYEKLVLDETTSSKFFNSYLDALDRNHSIFLVSDIKEFDAYKNNLDETLKGGNLSPAFTMFNRYRQRSEERIKFMLGMIDKGLNKLNFKKEETLELDREKSPWLKNKAEQEISGVSS